MSNLYHAYLCLVYVCHSLALFCGQDSFCHVCIKLVVGFFKYFNVMKITVAYHFCPGLCEHFCGGVVDSLILIETCVCFWMAFWWCADLPLLCSHDSYGALLALPRAVFPQLSELWLFLFAPPPVYVLSHLLSSSEIPKNWGCKI